MSDQPATQPTGPIGQGTDQTTTPHDRPAVDVEALPSTHDELRDWLRAIPALPRALLLRLLVDGKVQAELPSLRWEAVAEAVDQSSVAEVAAELGGISTSAVYSAVRKHKAQAVGTNDETE